MPRVLAAAALLGAAALLPAPARAQAAPAVPAAPPAPAAATVTREEECLGLAFGRWTPPLDARAAGHAPIPPAGQLPQAPNGRDWAAAIAAGRDTTLMLFPAWWPAGVHVRLPARVRTDRDTIRATAVALVADGRITPPTAQALVWLVPCGARPE
jgi:hypothetical protein